MSLSAVITPAVLDKVLGELAVLFLPGASGDLPTARCAASRLLAAYEAETEEELRHAADIVRFGFLALEALDRAMAPDLLVNRARGLRADAAIFNRRSEAAQHRLERCRRARQAAVPGAGSRPAADTMVIQEAAGLIASARLAPANGPVPPDQIGPFGHPAYTRTDMRRHAARSIAETFIRARRGLRTRREISDPPTPRFQAMLRHNFG